MSTCVDRLNIVEQVRSKRRSRRTLTIDTSYTSLNHFKSIESTIYLIVVNILLGKGMTNCFSLAALRTNRGIRCTTLTAHRMHANLAIALEER